VTPSQSSKLHALKQQAEAANFNDRVSAEPASPEVG
jgi:hypothetical protein